MIKKFVNDNLEKIINDKNIIETHNQIISCLHLVDLHGDILDIGERNPLTGKIEKEFNVKCDSAEGDFNYELITPKDKYDVIVCSHVIEHVVNALTLLNNMKSILKENGSIIIAYPIRFKTNPKHYYEIPLDRFYLLLEEAGLRKTKFFNLSGYFGNYLGIRPIIRAFYDRNYIFEVTKEA